MGKSMDSIDLYIVSFVSSGCHRGWSIYSDRSLSVHSYAIDQHVTLCNKQAESALKHPSCHFSERISIRKKTDHS